MQLQLIPRDIERAVKNTEDIDVSVVLHKIGDAVMPVEQNAHMARGSEIAITNFGKDHQVLRPFIYSLNGATGCKRIVGGEVFEYVFKPALGFFSPRYFCHRRIRRAISSLEITRFSSESTSPRSIMA